MVSRRGARDNRRPEARPCRVQPAFASRRHPSAPDGALAEPEARRPALPRRVVLQHLGACAARYYLAGSRRHRTSGDSVRWLCEVAGARVGPVTTNQGADVREIPALPRPTDEEATRHAVRRQLPHAAARVLRRPSSGDWATEAVPRKAPGARSALLTGASEKREHACGRARRRDERPDR